MSEIFIIIFLILLNGIFSMSEMAVVSARKSSLQSEAEKGNKRSKVAFDLASNPDTFLSVVQIGITLIGILTGIFSGNKIASAFAASLMNWGVSAGVAITLAKAVIVICVTYLSIIFGELVPKRIALSASEKVSKIIAIPMKLLSTLMRPFVWLLSKSTALVIKLIGVKNQESKITEEEIKSIIQEGTDEGEVLPVEQDIVERVFALGDLKVSTIMTLRSDLVWIDTKMSEEEIRDTIEKNLFESYPVAEGSLDKVVGVLTLKDFVLNIAKSGFKLENMIREAVYFHENMNVYSVLEQMKAKKVSRALICDEYGACSGIITLKDIIQALLGVVSDEGEEPEIIALQEEGTWLVDGQCSMYDFRIFFDIDEVDTDSEYSSVGGLILDELEHVPLEGEKASWKDFTFEVSKMDGARIDKVIVRKVANSEEENKNV